MNMQEAIIAGGICFAVGAACLATHSADPLWLLVVLIYFF